MALVPDATSSLQKKLTMLKINRDIVIKALRQLLKLYQQRKVDRKNLSKVVTQEENENNSDNENEVHPEKKEEDNTEVNKLADEVIFALKDDSGLEKEISNFGNNVETIVEKLETDLKVEEKPEPEPEPKQEQKVLLETRPTKSHVSKVISRCSSIDSQHSGPPRSPFQSNPLLTAHDYAKSPLMEGVETESGGSPVREDSNDSNMDITSSDAIAEATDSNGQSDSAERVDSSLDSNNVTMNDASDPLANAAPVAAAASDIDDDGAMSVDEEDPIKVEDVSKPNFDAQNVQLNEPYSFSPKDLVSILRSIKTDIFYPENQIRDEAEKRKKFRTDDSWRVHNYDHKFSCHAPRAKNAYLSNYWDSCSDVVTVTPNIIYKDTRLPPGWTRQEGEEKDPDWKIRCVHLSIRAGENLNQELS